MFELPFSTTVMLRSIADIARSEGENIRSPETRLECLKIFAFGGESHSDDASESGYYAVRYALAELSPVITRRVISKIAERFSIRVSQKAMAQIGPLIGAFSASTINTLFMNHFQNMAKGHFIVRRLERKYGQELIQAVYQEIPSANVPLLAAA